MKLSDTKTLSDIRKAYVLNELTEPEDYSEAKEILKDFGYDGDFTVVYGIDGWLTYDATSAKRGSKTSD